MSASATGSTVDVATDAEARAFIEAEIQTYLGLSLEEFYVLAEEGRLPSHPLVPQFVLMSGAKATAC